MSLFEKDPFNISPVPGSPIHEWEKPPAEPPRNAINPNRDAFDVRRLEYCPTPRQPGLIMEPKPKIKIAPSAQSMKA